MPVTRSTSRSSLMESVSISQTVPAEAVAPKRRRSAETNKSEGGLLTLPKVKRSRSSKTITEHQPADKDVPSAARIPIMVEPNATLIPAQLSFSFEDAKAHLIAADNRFKELFANVKCRPFEILEPLDPFR
jgi:DNA-3-methyladenine glycosylase II